MICSDRINDLIMTTNTEPPYFCWLIFYFRKECELKFKVLSREDLNTIKSEFT